jgi:hypothetical protein
VKNLILQSHIRKKIDARVEILRTLATQLPRCGWRNSCDSTSATITATTMESSTKRFTASGTSPRCAVITDHETVVP